MRTTAGVILQVSISIIFFVSHMVLEKRKLNLLTNSVVCSCSCSCSTSHYFIKILYKEKKIGQGSLFKFYNGNLDLGKFQARGIIFNYSCFYFTVSITPVSLWFFTLSPQSINNRFSGVIITVPLFWFITLSLLF